MKTKTYQDFDLSIEKAGDRYRARILNSPDGTATSEFDLPFADMELENFILRFGQTRRTMRNIGVAGETVNRSLRDFGTRLYGAIFSGPVADRLHGSLGVVGQQENAGLRIRLRLSDAPELIDVPWEYLFDASAGRFLSLSVDTPVVRYLDMPGQVKPLAVQPPLRILVMLSSPAGYAELNVEQEWKKLKQAVADLESRGLVVLERMEKPTLAELQRRLRKEDVHIFHFIGHGGFDEAAQDGVLILEAEDGKARPTSGKYLGALLHDEKSVQLAVLNACEGGRTSRQDPFAGVGQSLVQSGIPAVVAMQFEISDQAAITLAHEFYAALADSYPVDAALAEARKAIFAQDNPVEWGTPVLYMRAQDGKIFDVAAAEASPVTTQRVHDTPSTPNTTATSLSANRDTTPQATSALQTVAGDIGAWLDRMWRRVRTMPMDKTALSTGRQDIGESRKRDVAGKWTVRILNGHTAGVVSAAYSPDGTQIVTAGDDHLVHIWDAATGQAVRTLSGHIAGINSAVYSADGKQIVTASADCTVRLWDAATGQEVRQLRGHTDWVWSAVYSADGKTIVTASGDKTARLWDAATGQEVRQLRGHTDWVRSAAYSPDGKSIATACADRIARIWDAATGQEVRQLRGHAAAVLSAMYSPDGRSIVTASADGTGRIWDATTGQEVRQLRGHTDWVNSVAYSTDGKSIVTASGDRTARIWDAATGQEVRQLRGHTDWVNSVAFSTSGKSIITASADQTARIWMADVDDLLVEA